MDTTIIYKLAETQQDFEHAKNLFKEYADSLNIDLSFQNFEEELDAINKQYNKPSGGLYLAKADDVYAGCIGIRKLDDETAELKRMYVKNNFRGYGIGTELLKLALSLAKELGYKIIRLDTLKDMIKAQALYTAFGFYEIPPYRFNPVKGTVFMEKIL